MPGIQRSQEGNGLQTETQSFTSAKAQATTQKTNWAWRSIKKMVLSPIRWIKNIKKPIQNKQLAQRSATEAVSFISQNRYAYQAKETVPEHTEFFYRPHSLQDAKKQNQIMYSYYNRKGQQGGFGCVVDAPVMRTDALLSSKFVFKPHKVKVSLLSDQYTKDDLHREARMQNTANYIRSVEEKIIGATVTNNRGIKWHADFHLNLMPVGGTALSACITPNAETEETSLPRDLVVNIGRQLAEQIKDLHDKEVLHCDIKPGNVLMNAQGMISLIDYGLARSFKKGTVVKSKKIQGTRRYIAPEIRYSGQYSEKSDVYAFGMTLLSLLTPIPTEVENNREELLLSFVQDSHLDQDVKDLIIQMVHSNPEKRLSMDQICQHDFFKQQTVLEELTTPDVLVKKQSAFDKLVELEVQYDQCEESLKNQIKKDIEEQQTIIKQCQHIIDRRHIQAYIASYQKKIDEVNSRKTLFKKSQRKKEKQLLSEKLTYYQNELQRIDDSFQKKKD